MIGVLMETEESIRQALNVQPAHLNVDILDEDEEQEIAEEPVYVNIGKILFGYDTLLVLLTFAIIILQGITMTSDPYMSQYFTLMY